MKKQLAALLCSMLLLVQLCVPAAAIKNVYFLAINFNILPMTDATMPFWSGGVMYIPSSVFTGSIRKELDVGYVYNPGRQLLILYNSAKNRLEFDMSRNYVNDSEGNVYYRRALVRGDEVFVPAALVADYFDLSYSAWALEEDVAGDDDAWLVWLRKSDWTIPENSFVFRASSMMQDRYKAYQRTQGPPEQPEKAPQENEHAELTGRKVYLSFLADEAAEITALLDALDQAGSYATFYCTGDFLQQEGDLLRRMSATGHAVGLLADGADEANSVLEQLSRGNEALYRATCGKTRMVYLRNADEAAARAAKEAGYCCLNPQLDHSRYGLQSSGGASMLLQRAASLQGDVSVWLDDSATVAGVKAFLTAAGTAGNHCLSMTEAEV